MASEHISIRVDSRVVLQILILLMGLVFAIQYARGNILLGLGELFVLLVNYGSVLLESILGTNDLPDTTPVLLLLIGNFLKDYIVPIISFIGWLMMGFMLSVLTDRIFDKIKPNE